MISNRYLFEQFNSNFGLNYLVLDSFAIAYFQTCWNNCYKKFSFAVYLFLSLDFLWVFWLYFTLDSF
jgi:hypothetical protein